MITKRLFWITARHVVAIMPLIISILDTAPTLVNLLSHSWSGRISCRQLPLSRHCRHRSWTACREKLSNMILPCNKNKQFMISGKKATGPLMYFRMKLRLFHIKSCRQRQLYLGPLQHRLPRHGAPLSLAPSSYRPYKTAFPPTLPCSLSYAMSLHFFRRLRRYMAPSRQGSGWRGN